MADDTFNGHARLALIEHKGLRMEDVCQVLMNVQRVKQVDALQYLADLAG